MALPGRPQLDRFAPHDRRALAATNARAQHPHPQAPVHNAFPLLSAPVWSPDSLLSPLSLSGRTPALSPLILKEFPPVSPARAAPLVPSGLRTASASAHTIPAPEAPVSNDSAQGRPQPVDEPQQQALRPESLSTTTTSSSNLSSTASSLSSSLFSSLSSPSSLSFSTFSDPLPPSVRIVDEIPPRHSLDPSILSTHAPAPAPHNTPRTRCGFWNRRGDHLTSNGYIVYAPAGLAYPAELASYPEETAGYLDHNRRYAYWLPRPELPESLPKRGMPPERPYETFIIYEYK